MVPVCKSIVNQEVEDKYSAEENWVPCLKQISLNIVLCFAIKWLIYTCNKGILSTADAFLSFFGTFSLKNKIIDFLFFLLVALNYLRFWNIMFIFRLNIYLYLHG